MFPLSGELLPHMRRTASPYTMIVVKASLANKALREAAGVWRTYHPMVERKILQSVADTMPYAVLWLNLKRVVLKEFGFVVVAAPSKRIYFDGPAIVRACLRRRRLQ